MLYCFEQNDASIHYRMRSLVGEFCGKRERQTMGRGRCMLDFNTNIIHCQLSRKLHASIDFARIKVTSYYLDAFLPIGTMCIMT